MRGCAVNIEDYLPRSMGDGDLFGWRWDLDPPPKLLSFTCSWDGHVYLKIEDSKGQVFGLNFSPYSSGKAGSVRLEPFRLGQHFEC